MNKLEYIVSIRLTPPQANLSIQVCETLLHTSNVHAHHFSYLHYTMKGAFTLILLEFTGSYATSCMAG